MDYVLDENETLSDALTTEPLNCCYHLDLVPRHNMVRQWSASLLACPLTSVYVSRHDIFRFK